MTTAAGPLATEAAFVRAICERPGDDLPRLAFADWLEENAGAVPCRRCGEAGWLYWSVVGAESGREPCPDCAGNGRVSDGRRERAEFIRVSVEANASKAPCCHDLTQPPDCPTCALHLRAKALSQEWAGGACNWERWHNLPDIGWACLNLIGQPPPVEGREIDGQVRHGNYFRYRRGFVSEIRLPLAAFLAHAADLFAAHPATEVRLTDRAPLPGSARWTRGRLPQTEMLPDDLFGRLRGGRPTGSRRNQYRDYQSTLAARAAMSAACVSLGRELASLPPLG